MFLRVGRICVFMSRRVCGGGRGGLVGVCVIRLEVGEESTLEVDSCRTDPTSLLACRL